MIKCPLCQGTGVVTEQVKCSNNESTWITVITKPCNCVSGEVTK